MSPDSPHAVDYLVGELARQELVVERVLGHQVGEGLGARAAGNSAGRMASRLFAGQRRASIERANSLRA